MQIWPLEGPRSTLNMSIERSYANSCFMAILVITLSVTISVILPVEMRWLWRSNANMPIESLYVTPYLMTNDMLRLYFTICEIFAITTLILTIKIGQGQCKYAKRKPICDFLFVRHSSIRPVTVCEIITYKQPSVLGSYLEPWKRWPRRFVIRMRSAGEFCQRAYAC